jgi:hypothetical protein
MVAQAHAATFLGINAVDNRTATTAQAGDFCGEAIIVRVSLC